MDDELHIKPTLPGAILLSKANVDRADAMMLHMSHRFAGGETLAQCDVCQRNIAEADLFDLEHPNYCYECGRWDDK